MPLSFAKPEVRLLATWGSESFIAGMLDTIYGNKQPELADLQKTKKRLEKFLADGHHSVMEFMGAQWLLTGSRALSHELVRHRVASYWQESQRYVDYTKQQITYVVPPHLRAALSPWLAEEAARYIDLRAENTTENSRYVLSNAFQTKILIQMNAREFFLNFLPLRAGTGAFHEIRVVAWLMYDSIHEKFPITAEWVGKHLTQLHPDFCREVKPGENCLKKSIEEAFSEWELEVPRSVRDLMSQYLRTQA
ncbi:MAG: FAD-dependent thymidylate synthase [Thermoprotei archaeon]|nr:FAD-dependent thymidylate synthase [TACK group archaeon]